MTPTSPITGLAQTGLTSPTYTHVSDVAPDVNGRQVAVTALGGTQTGVEVHSGGAPFTLTFVRPKVFKALGPVNPVTGALKQIPRNTWKLIGRKGVIPLAGQPYVTMVVDMSIDIPAGAEIADPESIRACLSAFFGLISQQSAAIGDSVVGGVL